MNTFNFNRFSQALKCQFLVERKSWIRLFGIYTLVMFMANLFWTRVQGHSYDYISEQWGPEELFRTYNHYVEQSVAFGIVFFCIAMLFGATSMFSQMKDTRQRSAYLIWPVSNLEKYVVSFLHSFVLMAILTVFAYMLADALRVFVDWLTGRFVIWGTTKLTEPMGDAVFEQWQMAWMFFAWVFYIHSLYIVGGTLFRRQQFLLTSATIAVVAILLIIVLNQIDWNSVDINFITGTYDEKTQTYTQTFYPSFYIINSVVTLLIPFHYWASYKLFTRMQVINNKWLNV
ncbi:MAG: hypothetical protein K6E67_02835 [Prevotella sp.]|nr:hypothetical protein [Prevotella sp.]